MSAKDSTEIARLCELDTDLKVTSEDVRSYLTVGESALERFSPEERQEIMATILKEVAS